MKKSDKELSKIDKLLRDIENKKKEKVVKEKKSEENIINNINRND